MPRFPPPEIFRQITDQLEIGVYIVDRARKIQYWNRGAERITGYLAQDVVGRFCRDNILVHCDDHSPNLCGAECPLSEAMRIGEPHKRQLYLRHRDGHRIPIEIHVTPLHDESGDVTGAVEVFTEHVALPEFTNQNLVLAATGCLDEATDIPNHALIESYLREKIDLYERHRIPFAALVVRADRLLDFKALHGHEAEVAILNAIARTLRHSLRPTDVLGRWREDQFLALLPYSGHAPLDPAIEHLRNVVNCTGIPWWGDTLSINVSANMVKVRQGDTFESMKLRIDACFTEPDAGQAKGAQA